VAHYFGLEWIEIRSFSNNGIRKFEAKEVPEACCILERNKLHVTDIAKPLSKSIGRKLRQRSDFSMA
jgi:hypothetical protein